MLPFSVHHRLMAAIFLLGGTALLIVTLTNDWKNCGELSTTNPLNPAGEPSLNRLVITYIALASMVLAAVPWYCYKTYPIFRLHYFFSERTRILTRLMAKYDIKIITVNIWNWFVYLFLFISVSALYYIFIYGPGNLLLTDIQKYFINGGPIKCISGLSPYLWSELVMSFILVSLLFMVVISSVNIFMTIGALKKNCKIAPSGYVCFNLDLPLGQIMVVNSIESQPPPYEP